MHTIVGVPSAQIRGLADAMPNELLLELPVAVTVGYIGDLKYPHVDQQFHANDAGQLVVQMNVADRILPSAMYASLATPHSIDGVGGSEHVSRTRLARASALLTLVFGYSVLRDAVFDGEVKMASGEFSIAGQYFETPQPAHGPFRYPNASSDLAETCERLRDAHAEVRQRILLALEFFDRSLREGERFFYLWTALEILCNGKAQRIRSDLMTCYQLRNVKEVDEGLGFAQIARWRHEYFHKGTRPYPSADVERYGQLLFLDLLRARLGVEHRGFALGMANSAGFDLSPLGLADRRTPEQLAMAARLQLAQAQAPRA